MVFFLCVRVCLLHLRSLVMNLMKVQAQVLQGVWNCWHSFNPQKSKAKYTLKSLLTTTKQSLSWLKLFYPFKTLELFSVLAFTFQKVLSYCLCVNMSTYAFVCFSVEGCCFSEIFWPRFVCQPSVDSCRPCTLNASANAVIFHSKQQSQNNALQHVQQPKPKNELLLLIFGILILLSIYKTFFVRQFLNRESERARALLASSATTNQYFNLKFLRREKN